MLLHPFGDAVAGPRSAPSANPPASARASGDETGAFGVILSALERQGSQTPPANKTPAEAEVDPAAAAETEAEASGAAEGESADDAVPQEAAAPKPREQDPAGFAAAAPPPAAERGDPARAQTAAIAGGAPSPAPAGGANAAQAPGAGPGRAGAAMAQPVADAGAEPPADPAEDSPEHNTRRVAGPGSRPQGNGQPVAETAARPVPAAERNPAPRSATPDTRMAAQTDPAAGGSAPKPASTPATDRTGTATAKPEAGPTPAPATATLPPMRPAASGDSSLAQSVRERISAQNQRMDTAAGERHGNSTGTLSGLTLPAGMMPGHAGPSASFGFSTMASATTATAATATGTELPEPGFNLTLLPGAMTAGGTTAPLGGFGELLAAGGGAGFTEPAATSSASTPLPPPGSPAAAEMARSIAQQMGAQISADGKGRFEIALSPAELGRVEMVLQDSDNRLTLTVFAERPETMDLIRRNLGLLAQEMRDLGFAGLSLQLGGQGERSMQGGQTATPEPGLDHAPAAAPQIAAQSARISTGLTADHLDLRL